LGTFGTYGTCLQELGTFGTSKKHILGTFEEK